MFWAVVFGVWWVVPIGLVLYGVRLEELKERKRRDAN